MAKYDALPTVQLNANKTYLPKRDKPEIVHIDDPASYVMVDFTHAKALTIDLEAPIDDAAHDMELGRVHMLLVRDSHNKIRGLISSEIVLGTQPIRIMQERGLRRDEVLVKMVMQAHDKIIAFHLDSLQHAKVGHIINSLNHYQQRYALVVSGNQGKQTICGMFSSSQIGKQLHIPKA